MSRSKSHAAVNRRGFLKTSAAAAVAGSLTAPAVHAAGGDTLKIALVGCGGRGSGAAGGAQAFGSQPREGAGRPSDAEEDQHYARSDARRSETAGGDHAPGEWLGGYTRQRDTGRWRGEEAA